MNYQRNLIIIRFEMFNQFRFFQKLLMYYQAITKYYHLIYVPKHHSTPPYPPYYN